MRKKLSIICEECGNFFYITEKRPCGRIPKYCSKECRNKAYKRQASEAYYRRISGSKIYKLRNKPCARCGFSKAVILHDIMPASDDGDRNDSDNRVALCPNCHYTLHRNLWEIWEIEEKLQKDPDYDAQYWLVQILKSENYKYRAGRLPYSD